MATFEDGLRDSNVTVTILVLPVKDEGQARDDRPVMVMVGRRDEQPTLRKGLFSQIDALINEAWIAHGSVVVSPADEGETLAEMDYDSMYADVL